MILPFEKISKNDAPKAGGKGASLGEMTQAGIPVPPGFVVLSEAFESFLDTNSLRSEIKQILGNIDHNSVTSIEGASEKIQELIKNGEIPSEIQKEIQKYQETLDAPFVAVRSSATAEDGAEHAWAGQLDTYLNVAKGDVEKKIQSCWASLFTPRALFYRSEKGLRELHISVAVVVQSMVDAESAGVAFSVHPVTENHDEIVIEGSWGLGEAVVSGEVTPDSFVISKSRRNILSEHVAEKKKGIFRNKDGQNEWLEIDTEKREKPILTKEKIQKLSELIIQIENHYDFPCDIEWANSKEKIYILQARPITTLKQNKIVENESKWEKMVARHWYPLSWSGSSHIQREGLKFGNLHWKVNEYLAIRFGGPHITDFCTKENFIETNLSELLQEINNDIEGALDEIHKTIKRLMLIEPGKTKKDAKNIFNDFKLADGIMLMSFYFGPICQEILKNKIGDKTLEKYQIDFSSPSEPTLWVRESNDLTKIKKDILSRNFSREEQEKMAEKMAEKYGFIHSDIRATSWDKKDYLEEFSRPIIPHENSKDSFSTKDPYILWLKQIIGKISYAFDEGKCATIRTNWALRETIKNCGAREEQIMKCSENEFFHWIDTGKLPDTNLDEREKYHLMYTNNNEYEEFFDKEKIRKFLEKENIDEFEKIDESVEVLKGQIAFKGKIRGIVKKTYCEKDANELKPGEILVSTMTQPELMRGMIKSAAFITDEGGLLCHAAIIARELRKPCIIGTKIATKVLEDGDLVEVDADNGFVRVLEKKGNIFDDDWQLGATRNMPLWHDILCLYGWGDNMGDYGVDEKCKCLFAIENATHATMFMLPENQKKYFAATAECCKNGKAVRELRKKYEKYAAEVQHDLKQLAEKQNEKNWQKFFKSYQRFTAGLWITTGFGRIGTEKLEQELTKSGIQKEKIPEYIGLLTYPEEHTPLFLSQKDMLIIGNKIQKNKKTDTKKELQKWLEKHKYIPVNYCEDPWTLADAQEHLTNILEQDCEIALQKLEISHEKKIQARKKLGKKYGKNIREIGDALAEATSLNEYRKNIFCRLSYSIRYIFETIMKQVGSSDWRNAYYCTTEEILAIVGGASIDIQSIKDERKKCVFVREGDAVIWGDTEQVQKFFGKIYNTSEAVSETLRGFSANTGKITGTAKIVLSTKDFYKVQRGDILVTTMTSVDFVPIMEKAGAFVTNEGGITSHAAIVAREMDKPCIIGTKHATRMLKDGDLVEVDAESGIVKILKNNSEPDFSHKNLEVWIERKQSIFSMSVFHELESEVMKQHLGGGFRTQICFMKDKICSYIHEIGDFENVVNAITKKIKNSSEQEIREMIEKMNSWEKIGKKIIKEGHKKVMISKSSRKKYLEDYKNIGYWTTVVPYFLLEAINTIENQTAYKNLKTVCERLRSNSLYPILNEEITHKILEELTDTLGLEKGDWYYITWHETMDILEGNTPQNIESIKKRKNKENAFYRSENGQVIFLENKQNIQNLSEISYPKNTVNTINGVTAYPGKVQGKIKILRTTSDMRDFEQGDILVSPNSNPSLMHGIKKCGAMITDEGGVSCHAAIISRELQKPCIIGTKIATKVLKDGDVVEVDGETGTVKILEKKERNTVVIHVR